jgi:DNA-binding NtrC family response regulator
MFMTSEMTNRLDPAEIKKNLEKARENLIKNYMIKNFANQIGPLNEFIDKLEKDIIKYALLISEGNQKKAAFLLGLNPPTLCQKMKKYKIRLSKSGKEKDLLKSLQEIAKLFPPSEKSPDS